MTTEKAMKVELVSELMPRRGITKDGKAVLFHRIKYQHDWVVRADPTGEVLFRGTSYEDIAQWMESDPRQTSDKGDKANG